MTPHVRKEISFVRHDSFNLLTLFTPGNQITSCELKHIALYTWYLHATKLGQLVNEY